MEAKHRAVLQQYLLGALPEAERSRVAESYFVEEEFFEELLDVENELLDQYVRGRLSPEDRKRFGAYLIGLPDGAVKLATAHALMEAAKESGEVLPGRLATTASASRPGWTPLGGLITRRLAWRYAMVAILIASLAGVGYLMVTQTRLRGEVERLRAERNQMEEQKSSLERQMQADAGEQAVYQEQIRRLQAELDRASSNDRQQTTPETAGGVLASLVLTPALRSGGAPDLLTLTRATRTVSLVVPVANEEQTASYRLTLQTTQGRLVFSRDGLRPQSRQKVRTITYRLAAARLSGANYKLTLVGRTVDGVEIAQDFYFNVARK